MSPTRKGHNGAVLSLTPVETIRTIKNTPGIKAAITRTLSECDLYGSLRVIEPPGHLSSSMNATALSTPGCANLLGWPYCRARALVCDANESFHWDSDLDLASTRKLLKYPIVRFATRHGRVREGRYELLRTTLAKVGASLDTT